MLAPGPAAMATTRFHVAARQYASGPSASSMSVEAALGGARGRLRQLQLRDELAHDLERGPGRVVVTVRQRVRAGASTGPLREGRSSTRSAEGGVDVGRRRAVHAGDLHEAAERDRTDAVLDPAARRLGDRRREADVEPARAHAEPERRDEVTQLVDEDEHAEPDDREEDGHAGVEPPAGGAPRLGVGGDSRSSRSRAGAPETAPSASATVAAMSRNPIRPSRNASTATSFAAL